MESSMDNYQGFKQDIEDIFDDLIREFNLVLTEPYNHHFVLKGSKCNIKINYYLGIISCQFIPINQDTNGRGYGYEVTDLNRFLNPVKKTFTKGDGTWDSPTIQLKNNAEIIRTKLKNILDGDFSWMDNFHTAEKKEKELTGFVNNLGIHNPIYKKLWSGDPSWRDDAKKQLSNKKTNPQTSTPPTDNVFRKIVKWFTNTSKRN